MEVVLIVLACVAAVILALMAMFKWLQPSRRKLAATRPLSEMYRKILEEEVKFYRDLGPDGRKRFEDKLSRFLLGVKITGVNIEVEDIDRVLVGASAIIPVFHFDWDYINLREVLLYPETFGHEFEQEGGGRTIEGMVGEGSMQQVMILSRHALRQGFSNKTDKNNTAIHEFVHLIDKTDGETDGIPEILLHHQYTLPWIEMMRNKIRSIHKNKSDIDPYATTNQAEFFAVVAEYFFERPDLLRSKHPEVYEMLSHIFRSSGNLPETPKKK